ncbi:uncharacterized protein C16orf78 homolog isoform X2 [Manis javanica]|uniref:uncharacterized protein C16orf78 homolog isoform X2 n=1 Tax=Manis javanica TaxID=9974 RepID=UPI003C6D29A3
MFPCRDYTLQSESSTPAARHRGTSEMRGYHLPTQSTTIMSEKSEDLKGLMPTERKSTWRTAEERRMSDLTWVLQWQERRQGKKKPPFQCKPKVMTDPKATGKEEKKAKARSILKQQEGTRQVAFTEPALGQSHQRDGDPVTYQMLYGVEAKGKRLSMVPSNYARDGHRKSEIDTVTLEPTQWPTSYRRQSITEPTLQDSPFARRRSTLLRDWLGKLSKSSHERKLKSLMEKGTEPKMQMVNMPKPEEVLRCRYLRLSKNNIRTLLKLCKDAGMNVDIHPHMVEEIDTEKVFGQNPNIAL